MIEKLLVLIRGELLAIANLIKGIKLPDIFRVKVENFPKQDEVSDLVKVLKEKDWEIKVPDINIPEIKVPDINVPKVELPEINVEVPEIKVPIINIPKIEIPKIKMPPIIVPEIKIPKIKIPEVKIPKNIEIKGFKDFFKTIINTLKGKLSVKLDDIDRENPLPVILTDEKGVFIKNLLSGLLMKGGGGGGGESAILTDVHDEDQKALRVVPLERNEVRWTTEADFNKGTHFNTQTIPNGDGAISLKGQTQPDGVYAVWHLNELSGVTAFDSSGFGRDGTLLKMEDSDWVAGKLNNCLLFGGVDEYVNFGDIANFENTDAFSVEAWFRTNIASNQTIVARMGDTAPYRGWSLLIRSNGYIRLYLMNTAWTNLIAVDVPINYADGTWHQVIATYDGSSFASGVHIYVDGVDKILTVEYNSLNATILNNHTCSMAARNGAIEHFVGNLDEVLIYDKEINQIEVDFRWNSGNGREWEAGYELYGTYTSNVYDSLYPNLDYDKIYYENDVPVSTTAIYKLRTSNDNITWGEWSSALADGEDIIDNGRFIQWKADFTTSNEQVSPKLFNLSILYINQKFNRISP